MNAIQKHIIVPIINRVRYAHKYGKQIDLYPKMERLNKLERVEWLRTPTGGVEKKEYRRCEYYGWTQHYSIVHERHMIKASNGAMVWASDEQGNRLWERSIKSFTYVTTYKKNFDGKIAKTYDLVVNFLNGMLKWLEATCAYKGHCQY